MEELQSEILDELKIELGITEDSDIAILSVKLKNAIREVRQAASYPKSYTETQILEDLKLYIGNIKDLTMYDYSLIEAEGQESHNESGVNRKWKDREKCFNGIVRFANV